MRTIPVYDISTVYGTKAKTFHRRHHAEEYFRELRREYEPELLEVHTRYLTEEEFCYENLDD